MPNNQDLHASRVNAADEFYTDRTDVDAELGKYDFSGKRIYLPCDDWKKSSFYRYFVENYERLGLSGLTASSYPSDVYVSFDGRSERILKHSPGDDGDFARNDSREILAASDTVVTNPPFSLFRKFFSMLAGSGKEFVILGNINAITYREVFPHIVRGDVRLGHSIHSGDRKFYVPDEYPLEGTACGTDEDGKRFIRVKGVRWFTNMRYEDTGRPMFVLEKKFNPSSFPKFDGYDAIDVDSYKDVPYDYSGLIGCPITVMDRTSQDGLVYFADPSGNAVRFRVVGMLNSGSHPEAFDFSKPVIRGKCKFKRILIEKVP